MADRYEAADDAAVDELKRRARRRLVGAVVLALAAAIVVPMLLEREPRPLGDGVSVQIPPVDEGKFVNRLSDPKSGATSKAPKSDAAATKSISDAEQRLRLPLRMKAMWFSSRRSPTTRARTRSPASSRRPDIPRTPSRCTRAAERSGACASARIRRATPQATRATS
jgi:DedD protein